LAQPEDLPRLAPSRVLIRFVVTTIILVIAAAFSNIGFTRSLGTLTWMAMIVSSVVAVIRRERLFESNLNHGTTWSLTQPCSPWSTFLRAHLQSDAAAMLCGDYTIDPATLSISYATPNILRA